MELVLVERRFDQPVEFEDIQSLEDAGSWCLELHGVRFIKTFFSRDRRRMLCLYEAPDAEAVRLAESQAKVPYERAWTCMHLVGDSMRSETSSAQYIVAERRFIDPVKPEFVSVALQKAGWCLDLHRAEYIESFLGHDGLRMVCLFRAPDAEAVRQANRKAGVPYTQIWRASVHTAGSG